MENMVRKFLEDKKELYKFLRIRLSGQIERKPVLEELVGIDRKHVFA